LRGLSLDVEAGERVAVLGPNGAGKSTLLRLLALLTRPASGSLEIDGLSPSHDGSEVRKRLGVVMHESLLYADLTVVENLDFFARLYGVTRFPERRASLLARLDLERLAELRVRQLSRGQRQRVSIARALVHEPLILVLDEPDTGLDPTSLARVERELTSDSRRTVIFATHHAQHALTVATRVILLANGSGYDLGPARALRVTDVQQALLEAGA
jgi:ABC-type multidrug transport system ATPase subunit